MILLIFKLLLEIDEIGGDPIEPLGQEPGEMKVNVGVLSYNRHLRDYTKYVFGRDIPSAERVFGRDYPEQQMINDAYLAAHKEVGRGSRGNLNWLVLPNSGQNHTHTLGDP